MKKLKALFICSICCILIFSSVIFPEAYKNRSVPVWDGTTATKFESGSGTQTDPYIISNGKQLKLFSGLVNGTIKTYDGKNAYRNEFAAAYYKLNSDIKLNDTSDNANWAYRAPANEWTPIGYYTSSNAYASFSGSFDGQGHTISGLYIYSSKNRQGLFGCIEDGIVMNLNLTDSYIAGTDYVGGIVGYSHGSSTMIKNCYMSGSIYGKNYVGGIAGSNYSMIYSCFNYGYISGSNYTGGICGYGEWFSSIAECINVGAVSGGAYTGGLCGSDSGTSRIINCINIGSIHGTSYTGSIAGSGDPERITNCYRIASKTAGLGNTSTDNITAIASSDLKKESSYKNLDFSCIWTISEDRAYPLLAELVKSDSHSAIWDGKSASSFSGGSGSKTDPYKISSASQLLYLAELVNNGDSLLGKHFVLNADIKFNDTSVKGWTGNAISFTPIGTEATPFKGSFDGNDHTISGLYISGALSCTGLFGNNAGTITNVNIVSSYISGARNVGAIAGSSSGTISGCSASAYVNGAMNVGIIAGSLKDGATITGCTSSGRVIGSTATGGASGYIFSSKITNSQNDATIYGGESIGGIAGFADTNSEISNSKNSGALTGSENTGGIAGYVYYYSSVKACLNTGTISGIMQTGGITGYNCWRANVTDCLNNGSISGKSYTGGIVGYNYNNSSISTSYSTGKITSTSYIGGIAGDNTSAVINNSYYQGSYGGINGSDSAGATALDASKDILQSSYSGFDFSGAWVFVIGNKTGYPELRSFRTAYSVQFKDHSGNIYHADIYKYGETITLPDGAPSSYISGMNTYIFEKWDGFVEGTKATSDITYTASYIISQPVIGSDIYSILSDGMLIKRIAPSTLVSTFKSNLKTQYSITVLDSSGNQVANNAYAATGMTLVLTKDGTESRFKLVVTGDTNGDGKASITDFIQLKTYLLAGQGNKNLSGINELAGDINEDGKISITDFVQFKSHLLGSKIIL